MNEEQEESTENTDLEGLIKSLESALSKAKQMLKKNKDYTKSTSFSTEKMPSKD